MYNMCIIRIDCVNQINLTQPLFGSACIKYGKWAYWGIDFSIRIWNCSDCVVSFCFRGRWFSPGTSVSSTNKTDRHDMTEILLKVALNTIKTNKQTNKQIHCSSSDSVVFYVFHFIM